MTDFWIGVSVTLAVEFVALIGLILWFANGHGGSGS